MCAETSKWVVGFGCPMLAHYARVCVRWCLGAVASWNFIRSSVNAQMDRESNPIAVAVRLALKCSQSQRCTHTPISTPHEPEYSQQRVFALASITVTSAPTKKKRKKNRTENETAIAVGRKWRQRDVPSHNRQSPRFIVYRWLAHRVLGKMSCVIETDENSRSQWILNTWVSTSLYTPSGARALAIAETPIAEHITRSHTAEA